MALSAGGNKAFGPASFERGMLSLLRPPKLPFTRPGHRRPTSRGGVRGGVLRQGRPQGEGERGVSTATAISA
jgi:hypothetical protein